MGKPKKQKSNRKTGFTRSHLLVDLARVVNKRLSHDGAKVRAYTTKRESGAKEKARVA